LDLRYHDLTCPLPVTSYQAQAAWCSPCNEALRLVLDRKDGAIRTAIADGRISAIGPLWLLIVANNPNDISSFAFASAELKIAIDACGFDFEASVFQEVWMLDGCHSGRVQRLYPWESIRSASGNGTS